MTDIDRNNPCPCGSGKKYKRCCLQNWIQSIGTVHLLNGEKDTFREEDVIGGLLRSSKEFPAFYEVERAKIDKPLHWVLDSDLPEGIRARHTIFPGGEQRAIRLRRVPAWLKDACVIAHEIGHSILDVECFPFVGCRRRDFEYLASALGSMLQDPVINRKLVAYGFNVQEQYDLEISKAIQDLGGISPPSDHLGKVWWIFNYVSEILEWETACSQTDENEFQLWFDARHPEIAQDGQELLGLVHDIGYDVPEKQTVLLKRIIQQYGIANTVILRDHQGVTWFGE